MLKHEDHHHPGGHHHDHDHHRVTHAGGHFPYSAAMRPQLTLDVCTLQPRLMGHAPDALSPCVTTMYCHPLQELHLLRKKKKIKCILYRGARQHIYNATFQCIESGRPCAGSTVHRPLYSSCIDCCIHPASTLLKLRAIVCNMVYTQAKWAPLAAY